MIKTPQYPIWHPCSQMKDYEQFPPLSIARAYGSEIELTNGLVLIDAIASWWCKSLGHQHPRLKKVLIEQLDKFEHVLLANTTNESIFLLSQRLCQYAPHLQKVFYASEGSSAVEIALKMSLHAQQLRGQVARKQFIALKNGYHGETIGAMSVSDVGLYTAPYEALMFNSNFIDVCYANAPWQDNAWSKIEAQLDAHCHHTAAIIVEPMLQGAGGMQIYHAKFLQNLAAWAKQHQVFLIADEIMTGIGRTGKMLACEHAGITPDIVCLAKGLTSGFLPFSAVLTTNAIYDLFYDDYRTGKAFLHSHTFSGHVLGAVLALEVLNIIAEENLCERANQLGQYMLQHMQSIATRTQRLTNIRQLGAMVAADLILAREQRAGFEVFKVAVKRGALLRPLGNTIYWLPPLTTSFALIDRLADITEASILQVFKQE